MNKKGNGPIWKLDHVAIVVKDIEKTMEYYSSLGIGPFVDPAPDKFPKSELRGGPLPPAEERKVIRKIARMGPVDLWLVQPMGGKGMTAEVLQKRGEGLAHLGFQVDDIDKAEAELVNKGIKVTYKGRRDDGAGFTFLDTEANGGVVFEMKSY